MDSFTVPIGLPPKIKKSGAPDVNGLVIQELQYSFMARHYNLFALFNKIILINEVSNINWQGIN